MPCILKSSLAVAEEAEAEAGAAAAVEGAVQVPRVPAEGFPPRPRVHVRPAAAQVPGPAQAVARRLRRGLQVRPRAQKPEPSPRVPQPGKPPEPDSDRALPPQARQKSIDRRCRNSQSCRCREPSLVWSVE